MGSLAPPLIALDFRKSEADLVRQSLASPKLLVPVLRSVSVDQCRSHEHQMCGKEARSSSSKLVHLKPSFDDSSLLWNLNEYTVHRPLGRGATGNVYLGTHNSTQQNVAIKIIDKRKQDLYTQGRHECAILESLNHRNIVRLVKAVENEHRLAIVLQFAEKGDLYSYLSKNPDGLPEKTAKRLFQQLITAVHYVHLQGYAHRDVKPGNILITQQDKVLLCDFSMATTWSPLSKTNVSCGSLPYAAPEVLSEKPYTGPEIDIFSCGAVLYFMLSGRQPFEAHNEFDMMRNAKAGKRKPLDRRKVSRAARDLVDRMLHVDPLKRATMLDILVHPWFTNKKVESCLSRKGMSSKASRERMNSDCSDAVDRMCLSGSSLPMPSVLRKKSLSARQERRHDAGNSSSSDNDSDNHDDDDEDFECDALTDKDEDLSATKETPSVKKKKKKKQKSSSKKRSAKRGTSAKRSKKKPDDTLALPAHGRTASAPKISDGVEDSDDEDYDATATSVPSEAEAKAIDPTCGAVEGEQDPQRIEQQQTKTKKKKKKIPKKLKSRTRHGSFLVFSRQQLCSIQE